MPTGILAEEYIQSECGKLTSAIRKPGRDYWRSWPSLSRRIADCLRSGRRIRVIEQLADFFKELSDTAKEDGLIEIGVEYGTDGDAVCIGIDADNGAAIYPFFHAVSSFPDAERGSNRAGSALQELFTQQPKILIELLCA